MRTVKVLTGAEAAMLVKDGDTITTSGFVACGLPETLSKALEPVSYTHLRNRGNKNGY